MVPPSSKPRKPLPDAREVPGASSAAPGGADQRERIQTTFPPGPHPVMVLRRLHHLCGDAGASPAVWGSKRDPTPRGQGRRKGESRLHASAVPGHFPGGIHLSTSLRCSQRVPLKPAGPESTSGRGGEGCEVKPAREQRRLCWRGRHLQLRPRGLGEVSHWAPGKDPPMGFLETEKEPSCWAQAPWGGEGGRGCQSPPELGGASPTDAPSVGPAWGPWGPPCAPWPARQGFCHHHHHRSSFGVGWGCGHDPLSPAQPPIGPAPRDPGSPTLGRACRSKAIRATQRWRCWRLALPHGSPDTCDENPESPGFSGSCTTSPNYASEAVWQPGENSRTLYILVQIRLPAVWLQGQACLCGPREMGVCSRPRGRGPRPE